MSVFQFDDMKANAETGEFYDKYKEQIESRPFSEHYRVLMEKYDYDTNSFDCGLVDFYCKVFSGYYEAIIGINQKMYTTIESIGFTPNKIMDNPEFKRFKEGFSVLSKTMLGIFIMWHAMSIVAQSYMNPEGGAIALNQKLVKLLAISIVLFLYDDLMNLILLIISMSFRAVVSAPHSIERTTLMIFLNGRHGILLSFLVAGSLVVFYVAFTYRLVLYGFMYAVGVIAIPTALNDEYDYFSVWLRTIINNGVTVIAQGITFSLGFQHLIGGRVTLGFALFILTLTVPSLLGQLGASSGAARGIATVVRTVARR
ncbi:conjugal transfer protein TraL [Cytobacillus oceanisediminis]|uniref:conjugal transfer protein TrbL family protein n=1 Tax=Cytobacillus oceanisediminis TaxID=665099 RepID=UPI001C224D84|nr:conjugal transfer protein TrbL family protein [Cytobacillus oceanisediminis]MBU8732522.1 conjugal transfer protein TraL [Cytobacillus oceanisediminis]